jgi:hypothetical protein
VTACSFQASAQQEQELPPLAACQNQPLAALSADVEARNLKPRLPAPAAIIATSGPSSVVESGSADLELVAVGQAVLSQATAMEGAAAWSALASTTSAAASAELPQNKASIDDEVQPLFVVKLAVGDTSNPQGRSPGRETNGSQEKVLPTAGHFNDFGLRLPPTADGAEKDRQDAAASAKNKMEKTVTASEEQLNSQETFIQSYGKPASVSSVASEDHCLMKAQNRGRMAHAMAAQISQVASIGEVKVVAKAVASLMFLAAINRVMAGSTSTNIM